MNGNFYIARRKSETRDRIDLELVCGPYASKLLMEQDQEVAGYVLADAGLTPCPIYTGDFQPADSNHKLGEGHYNAEVIKRNPNSPLNWPGPHDPPSGSPWGPIDFCTTLIPGHVFEVSTPSHGGIGVNYDWAMRFLSEPARTTKHVHGHSDVTPSAYTAAVHYGPWFWYEEDCAWAVAAYDNSLIAESMRLNIHDSNRLKDPRELAEHIEWAVKQNWPEYYEAQRMTRRLKVGDTVTAVVDITWGMYAGAPDQIQGVLVPLHSAGAVLEVAPYPHNTGGKRSVRVSWPRGDKFWCDRAWLRWES